MEALRKPEHVFRTHGMRDLGVVESIRPFIGFYRKQA